MPFKNDDNFLARWMAGKLTAEEILELEGAEEYDDFRQILRAMDFFREPTIDHKALRDRISTVQQERVPSRRFKMRAWYYAAAAVFLLFFTTYFVLFSSIAYRTGIGEKTSIQLPDGSLVQLNADTHLERARFLWEHRKVVRLVRGEAMFEVRSGPDFRITTREGDVTVLGTSFNIRHTDYAFIVDCFEGTVQFDAADSNESFILTAGDGIEIQNDRIQQTKLQEEKPDWVSHRSVFRNEPLGRVLEELQEQFPIRFKSGDIDLTERYSGSFDHDDPDLALQTVLLPMGISYEKSSDGVIELRKDVE